VIGVEEFRAGAQEWLADQKATAPPNWGPIMPPERREQGMEWQQRLHAAGYAGIHWPVEYGGRGLSIEHQQAWMECCADAGVPPFINMVGLVLAAGAIQLFGTEEQKLAHLPETARGERVWCQLFSEPGAGSDLASLQTRAEQDGDGWVVNGQKVWCSGGRASDWGILLARTEHDMPKHKGISFFLVDMGSDGVDARSLRQMTGGAEFDEVFLTDVHLPSDALLGERGAGWQIGMATLMNERGHIGGMSRSLTRRLEGIQQLAAGSALGGVDRDRLVRLYAEGGAYLHLTQRQGPTASVGSSLGKLGMTGFMFDLAEVQADLSGADAMLSGAQSDPLLAAPGGWFGGGTSQVQRNIIGERILGLPREPRA
jgi:alkylation response protein AidB-like acyl-CoA dehydrogenase